MLATLHTYLPIHCLPCFSKSKTLPFKNLYHLKDLAQTLTSDKCDLDQWLTWKKDIKFFVQEKGKNLEQLDHFLKTITEWGIKRDPQKTLTFLLDIMSLDQLNQVVKFQTQHSEIPFKNVVEWAVEQQPFCPELIKSSFKTRVYSEWKRCCRFFLYFIPNLINVFLRAFNFLDAYRQSTSIWELNLVLEILYKFFIIPCVLIKILQPLFAMTVKVYLVAALIIVATGIVISCYLRWFRPMPDEIINCTNLDKKLERGEIEPKVGQAREMERLTIALRQGRNVVIVGDSGEGKNSLVEQFVQAKNQKKLSQDLQKLAVYEVDCGVMISNVSFGHSELITKMKSQIKEGRHPERALLFFDEFQQIVTNKGAFQAFKKCFLEDKPHSLFVAAITAKEFQELKKIDGDGSFRRRVVRIMVQSSSNEQNRLILRELIHRIAKDIPITDEAIETILEISALEDYLPGIGRPAKAIKILMDALGLCRASYDSHYVPVKLRELYQEYEALKLQGIHEVKIEPITLKKMRELKAIIENSERELKKNRQCILKIKKILAEQQKLHADYYHHTHLIAKEKSVSQAVKIRYLWYYFYAIDALKKILKQKIAKVSPSIVVQVDKALIYQVYDEFKTVEKALYHDMEPIKR